MKMKLMSKNNCSTTFKNYQGHKWDMRSNTLSVFDSDEEITVSIEGILSMHITFREDEKKLVGL